MLELKQGATDKVIPFLMVSSANHIDGATGLTPTVTISKNGSALAAPAGTVAEIGAGWYKLSPAAADTNTAGSLILHAEAAGADPSDRECLVVSVDPYDAVGGGLSRLDAAVTTRATPAEILATPANPLATDGTGRVTVGANADKGGYSLAANQAAVTVGTVNTLVNPPPDSAGAAAVNARLPAIPAAVGSPMTLDLTQAVPTANTAQSVGDALNAARAQGFGKWVQAGNILTLFAPDGITPVRTFTLDSATDPTQRV